MPFQRMPNPLCGKEALNKEFLIEFDQNVVVPGCGEVLVFRVYLNDEKRQLVD